MRIWNIRENSRDFRDPESNAFEYGQDPLSGYEVARETSPIAHFSLGKTGRWDNDEMALVV